MSLSGTHVDVAVNKKKFISWAHEKKMCCCQLPIKYKKIWWIRNFHANYSDSLLVAISYVLFYGIMTLDKPQIAIFDTKSLFDTDTAVRPG